MDGLQLREDDALAFTRPGAIMRIIPLQIVFFFPREEKPSSARSLKAFLTSDRPSGIARWSQDGRPDD
jgi:hypothetical protein